MQLLHAFYNVIYGFGIFTFDEKKKELHKIYQE